MNLRDKNRFDMFIKVQQFGVENSADFSATLAASDYFTVINSVITELKKSTATQTSGAVRQTTAQKSVLRDAIRDKMKAIARTARALAISNPGLNNLFRLPDNNSDQLLLSSARKFVEDAENFKPDFVRFGLSEDFLDDLKDDIVTFEQAMSGKASATGEKVAATASIDDLIEQGINAAQCLDAIAKNVYRNNRAKLAAWTTARHIERLPKKSEPKPPVQ